MPPRTAFRTVSDGRLTTVVPVNGETGTGAVRDLGVTVGVGVVGVVGVVVATEDCVELLLHADNAMDTTRLPAIRQR